MHVKRVGDKVGYDRRTGASLRKRIIMTGDLRYYGRHIFMQLEVLVLNEEPTYPTKIDRREEILDVDVEHVTPVPMLPCVAHD